MNYTQALNSNQAEVMREFLTALSHYSRIAEGMNIKPDVDRFMNEWRGYKGSEKQRIWSRESYRRRKQHEQISR
jgi:UV DNA damage repair endonuclease